MVYGQDWLLEEILQVTHRMTPDRSLYLSPFISQVIDLNHTGDLSEPSSSGFQLRLTLQLCKDRNFIIAASSSLPPTWSIGCFYCSLLWDMTAWS